METIVEFSHVSMEFPGVKANDDVSFSIRKGEIFALVGENGAGKSTLMNLLYGIYAPTGGEIFIQGRKVTDFRPKNAIAMGVGMVHQHFMLVPSFTVAENIVLSREPRKHGVLYDRKAANERVRALSRDYGLEVNPTDTVGTLGVGLQQRVEILKTLYRGAEILILDEPTAVLTPQETQELFEVLRRVVAEKNMTVILITHKLYEVMAVSDRVGVLRQGKLIGVKNTADVNERMLAAMMVGKDLQTATVQRNTKPGEVKLELENLQVWDNRGLAAVRDLSLQVRGGQIVGIAAVEGNGQSELLEAITGMRRYLGTIRVNGQDIRGKSPGAIRALGLAHVPEDRLATGVDRDGTITDNLLVMKHRKFALLGLHLQKKPIRAYADKLYHRFDIRSAGLDTKVGSLSGGNMQKVVIAREFSQDADVYIIAQPTRGVDIGATQFIHSRILEKRDAGAAILLSSADLDEVLALSDRVIAMYEGRITGELTGGQITKTKVGLLMTGGKETAHEAKN